MAWVYDVKTHTFTRNGETYTADYAGATGYKNDSSQECMSGKGPLPRGTYTIGHPHHSPHTGKYTLNLIPNLSNAMCGRSAFRIHGASKNGLIRRIYYRTHQREKKHLGEW